MECLRSFRRGDGEASLKDRVVRSLDPPEANAARPTPWTLQAMLASAFFCRGPPSADDDDVPPRVSASGQRKPGMRRPPSASPLPDIPESGVGDAAAAGDAASDAATADAVEVMLSEDSPSRRPPAGAAGGEPLKPTRKLSHRRSWSWSMQWSAGEPSAKARRRHESGERGTRAPAEADEADEEGFSDVFSRRRDENSAAEKNDVSAAEEDTGTSTPAVPDATRPSHSRSGSWSEWASVSAASWFTSKTPEEREEAKRAREARKEKRKRDLADAEALRARATEENDQLDRVMQESKLLHEHSLPLTTRSRDAAAACVLVTPPPKPPRRSERGDDDDDDDGAAEDAQTPATRSASRANAGEWVDVELRGIPSRWAKKKAADSSLESFDAGESDAGQNDGHWKIRASAFFATLDQRGARGEGSCTLCCVALAEWLAANPGRLPTEAMRTSIPSASFEASIEESPSKDGASDTEPSSDGEDASEKKRTPRFSLQPRFALDFIVTGAAREWRRLCSDESLVARFPDKHFDLDTAAELHAPFSVEAEMRFFEAESEAPPASDGSFSPPGSTAGLPTKKPKRKSLLRAKIHHDKSFVGFLRPPGVAQGDSPALDALAEAAPPLETIVRELSLAATPATPSTYAVSWNDHFFTLHFRREAGATVAYVMDSLGERLCEGCRRAYVLRFDSESLESTSTFSKPYAAEGKREFKDGATIAEPLDAAAAAAAFIGDVLPSRALRDVGAQILAAASGAGKAEQPDPETLMRRLQIEFHRVEAERA